jgi:hypothetical protein
LTKKVSEAEQARRARQSKASHQSKTAIDGWISEKEMSAMTGRSLRALRKDRQLGRGMPWSRFGKSVF